MKKEIIDVNKKLGIKRITTLNERWYAKPMKNSKTGLPEYQFFPSSTWIAGYYPKGIEFYKWLAEKGWDEAEALKSAAGDRGSKIHQACMDLDNGIDIDIVDSKYMNNSSGQMEELSPDEIEAIVSYDKFLNDMGVQVLMNEMTVFGEFYAGTADKVIAIKDKNNKRQIWIVDLKSGQNIWEEYILQISSYSHAPIEYALVGITEEEWKNRKLAILQVGYKRNKNGYKFTEISDKYDLFETAHKIWLNENGNAKPKQRDLPLIIKGRTKLIEK